MVLDFNSDGSAQSMHRDEFNLGFLGRQEIVRASEIKFDTATQRWNILVPCESTAEFICTDEACGFAGYDEARQMEVKWLDGCRLVGISPLSEEGRSLLRIYRES